MNRSSRQQVGDSPHSGTVPNQLIVITDTTIQNRFSHIELAEMAIRGGADIIQLRDKTMKTGKLLKTALAIQALCKKAQVKFIVNDRVDIVLLSDADGVHLGQDDLPIGEARKILGPSKTIGATTGSLEQALEAEKLGADYIGFGHIFPTLSKAKLTQPQGLEKLQEVCARVKISVIAVGGINALNIQSVLKCEPAGIAVIAAVCATDNPEAATHQLSKWGQAPLVPFHDAPKFLPVESRNPER